MGPRTRQVAPAWPAPWCCRRGGPAGCCASALWAILFFDHSGERPMKVSDILRVKGGTLFCVDPEQRLAEAVNVMSENDIGSLVVMEHGGLVGMLTFREVIKAVVRNGGSLGDTVVRSVMDQQPLTC